MAYFAANAVPITQSFSGAATFPAQDRWTKGFTRLDVFAHSTDAIVQFLMDDDAASGSWQNDQSQEILCLMGFHSVPMESSRFEAVRFKVWSQTLLASSGTVHIRCFS